MNTSTDMVYTSPQIEVEVIEIEKGFAASGLSTDENEKGIWQSL